MNEFIHISGWVITVQVNSSSRAVDLDHIRTWNLPALVRYFTPLKGLYFSPYMSSRFTFKPLTANWLMAN